MTASQRLRLDRKIVKTTWTWRALGSKSSTMHSVHNSALFFEKERQSARALQLPLGLRAAARLEAFQSAYERFHEVAHAGVKRPLVLRKRSSQRLRRTSSTASTISWSGSKAA